MTHLVIGNSAAATAAVEAIRWHDAAARIVQVTRDQPLVYSRCLLPHYLADEIGVEKLTYREAGFHDALGIELHAGPEFRVVRVQPDQREVLCDGGHRFFYDRLLVSSGASAKLPAVLLDKARGIHVLRDMADAMALREAAPHASQAAVLGGGLVGVKTATALRARGVAVTMIVNAPRVLSRMIDDEASAIVAARLESLGISLVLGADVEEVEHTAGALTGVRLKNGTSIPCRILVAAKGVSTNADFLPGAERADGGLLTDAHMRTTIPEIWAAGDAACAYDIVTERHAVNALWTCAVQQGRVAGSSMAGRDVSYNGTVGMNALDVGGLPLIAYGEAADTDVAARTARRRTSNSYRRLLIGADNRIKGVILLGHIAHAGVLLSLLRRRVDVSGFAEDLLDDRFDYGAALRLGGEAELAHYRAGTPA